jgi:hypothetical protein
MHVGTRLARALDASGRAKFADGARRALGDGGAGDAAVGALGADAAQVGLGADALSGCRGGARHCGRGVDRTEVSDGADHDAAVRAE